MIRHMQREQDCKEKIFEHHTTERRDPAANLGQKLIIAASQNDAPSINAHGVSNTVGDQSDINNAITPGLTEMKNKPTLHFYMRCCLYVIFERYF